jgi:hypothetical protein
MERTGLRGREGDACMTQPELMVSGDRADGTLAEVARAALRLALDGCEPPSTASHAEAYRLARRLNTPRWGHVLEALSAAPDGAICVVGAGADGIGQLLRAVGLRYTRQPGWNELAAAATIVCLGCPGATDVFDSRCLLDFMRSGGLLITSDHAAPMLSQRGLLTLAGRGAPRRARARRPDVQAEELLPVVCMPAGHDRVAPPAGAVRGRTLAVDALTDEPLVMLVPVGVGALLHAVPHWFQDDPATLTALERRPARCAPLYAGLDIAASDLSVGDLQAAETMLGLLLEGIDAALALDGAAAAAAALTQRPASPTTAESSEHA